AAPYGHGGVANGHSDAGITVGVEIVCLERAEPAVKPVIGTDPRILGGIRQTIRSNDGDTSRYGPGLSIECLDVQLTRRMQILLCVHLQLALSATHHIL